METAAWPGPCDRFLHLFQSSLSPSLFLSSLPSIFCSCSLFFLLLPSLLQEGQSPSCWVAMETEGWSMLFLLCLFPGTDGQQTWQPSCAEDTNAPTGCYAKLAISWLASAAAASRAGWVPQSSTGPSPEDGGGAVALILVASPSWLLAVLVLVTIRTGSLRLA